MIDGSVVFVAGGAGEVGEGIVRQFLKAGAKVVTSSRSQSRLDNLQSLLSDENTDNLFTYEADISTVAGAEALRDTIQSEVGAINHVVASLGGWWQGKPLVDIELDLWHQLINNSLTAHFITAKVFLPVTGGTYTLINGGGALHPVPTAGPISVSAAGQIMLQKVLSAENADSGVKINTLVLATPVLTRSRPNGQLGWISADDAGKYCVYLASDGTENDETIIFDSPEKILAL